MNKTTNKVLRRDPVTGKVAGVCAGLAEYFGWEVWLVRIIIISGLIFSSGLFFVGYIAAWFILDKKEPGEAPFNSGYGQPSRAAANSAVEVKSKVWQAGEPPRKAFYDIERQFSRIERRLRSIEGYVTSPEFTVSREINKL